MYRIVYFNTGNGYQATSGELHKTPEEAAKTAVLVTMYRQDSNVADEIWRAEEFEDGTDYCFENGALGVKLEYVSPEDARD